MMMWVTLLTARFAPDWGWRLDATLAGLQVGASLLILVLEWLLPYRKAWLRSRGDVATDLAFLASTVVTFEVMRGLVQLLAAAGLRAQAWPSQWPLPGQLVLALLMLEFGNYAVHRWQHERGGWLWRLHASHHSVPRMYWLNSARNHPLDVALAALTGVTPLIILGIGEHALALVLAFQGTHGLLQHSNVDVRLGPLNWVVSGPEVHRWHHSRDVAESNANYGQLLLVWDVVFGTRKVPTGKEPPAETGMAESAWFPQGFWQQLAVVWRWRG